MNLVAPFSGTVLAVPHALDETVSAGTPVIVLEAMKMEHELVAEADGVVVRLEVEVGETVSEGQLLAVLGAVSEGQPMAVPGAADEEPAPRPVAAETEARAFAEVHERHSIGLDDARPDAVRQRRERGHRTARENLTDLLDEGRS